VRFETGWLARAMEGFWITPQLHEFILVSTDSDFQSLVRHVPEARIVILRSCDYPTDVAAAVLRSNAIRISELPNSRNQLMILDK
jgi:predicted nuclease of predicted toxin-antitoxin system